MPQSIISTFHHGFAGGSKNTSRLLNLLSSDHYSIHIMVYELPQYFQYEKSNINIHNLESNLKSDVIKNDTLQNFILTEALYQLAKNQESPILFGANLFPYCDTLLQVKKQLYENKKLTPKLIIHPVGSDLWQIGPFIPSRVKWLLDNPSVDTIITYSQNFKNEIKEFYNIKKKIFVLPPILEEKRFYPISFEEKFKKRKQYQFSSYMFIIHHHSSMRPIKCPEVILQIVMNFSQLIQDDCTLIMSGPIHKHTLISIGLRLEKVQSKGIFIYQSIYKNLRILWTGVISNVEDLLQISDVEINASLHDSFNISLLEAMACGVPVITSDVVGIKEHIQTANAGFLMPTEKLNFTSINKSLNSEIKKEKYFDIDFAVQALLKLYKNRSLGISLGNLGADYTKKQFNPNKILDQFKDYLK